MDLQSATERAIQEDVFRLAGVSLWIPTDEQIAKSRQNYPDLPVQVSLRVEWEPMTYHKRFNDDPNPVNEVDFIQLTKGRGLSAGDEAATLAFVRESGFLGIPAAVRQAAPRKGANLEKQTNPYARFMAGAALAGIVLSVDEDGSVTGQTGGIYSKQVGGIYSCRAGAEAFPGVIQKADGSFGGWDWDNTRDKWMRVPVKQANDFVQPDEIPERHYVINNEGGQGTAVTSGSSQVAALTAEDILAAVRQLGIDNQPVGVVNASAIGIVASKTALAPAVLGSGEFVTAASGGSFVDYLATKGAVSVESGVVHVN